MANAWPAEKVGGPHCKGYGNMNLTNNRTQEVSYFSEAQEYGM